ncbi:cell wall-binding protein, partial [Bacillus pseudomycoides]
MNEKYKKRLQKVLPVGIAMGVLFSANPVTENKVSASIGADTIATILKSMGDIYDAFIREPVFDHISSTNAQNRYNGDLENLAYVAPSFKKGEF